MNGNIVQFEKLKFSLFRERKIQLLYRGDCLESVCARFGIINENNEYDREELLKRIFLIGDKARHFYKENILRLNQYRRRLGLTNSNDIALEEIFVQLNSAAKSNKPYLKEYFEKNRAIKDFFSDIRNISAFINSIHTTGNKFSYRNYYLTILHQLYYIEYRNNSHFVSTSSRIWIAKNFAGKSGIIIHSWKPIDKFKRLLLKKYRLPRQTKVAFRDQKETSLIGGILPHFIVGVEFLEENEFYYNNYIINNEVDLNTFMFGLNINQESFFEVIKKTSFRKSFTIVGKRIREQSNY